MKTRLPYLFSQLLLVALLSGLPADEALAVFASNGALLQGRLLVMWGDGLPGSGRGQLRFLLQDATGAVTQLDLSAVQTLAEADLYRFNGQQVVIEGSFTVGMFAATSLRALPGQAAAPLAVTGSQPWVSALCKFSDQTAEPRSPAFFSNMYSDVYPGLNHYWREQSYDQANVNGSMAVSHWYTLPHPRAYYVYDIDSDGAPELDFTRAASDCTAAVDSTVYFPAYAGINLMFNADLDGYAWGGKFYLNLDGQIRVYQITWEPPWGYGNIGVIEHEMGHGFGLPHSSWNRTRVYDNRWDVMSDNWTDGGNATDATYGVMGQHTIAYHKEKLGWLDGRTASVNPANRATLTLERLAQPGAQNLLMVKVPIQGDALRYYTIEARQQVGYDAKLPGSAVVLHLVDTSQSIPAQLVNLDPAGGLAGQMWLPGETYEDVANQIKITVVAATASGFTVSVSNRYVAIDSNLLDQKCYLPILVSGE